MRWWKFFVIFSLAALGALGCGSSKSSGVSIAISPTAASVITNRTQQFTGAVNGSSNVAITWSLACASGVAANSCGSIDASGLYTAPATIPKTTSGSTTTPAPTVTITATSQADTSKTATATLTIITGISIVLTPTSATVGTGETFTYAATVNNPGCNTTSNPTCDNVTWSLSTTLTGIGTIGSTTGVYKAPTSVPSPSTVIITATSVADTSVTATATATVVTASTPTVKSVSPNVTALGGLFQDIYITGTNFISTDNVFVNGAQLSPTFVTGVSTSLIRARIPDFILAVPPASGILQIGVSEQAGAVQTCTSDPSACQISVSAVRPGVIGPSPNTIAQGTSGVVSFNVDGGFFGTGANPASPAVSATFNGQLRGIQLPASQTVDSTRQLSVSIGGAANAGDFSVGGLYPVAIKSAADPTKFAVTNVAVQPTTISISPSAPNRFVVGSTQPSKPSDVAVNPATGMAVVANFGSNDVSLIDLSNPSAPPTNLCTYAPGMTSSCPSTPSGPTGVAIDYVNNRALVVNSTAKTIAVVDLNPPQSVTAVLPVLQDTPMSIGINPATGRALVAMQQKNYGVLIDLTQNPPQYNGIVSVSTGSNPHVAVEPNLNWALVTPGGLGSLGIVDLSQFSTNPITNISRTSNVVTVTLQASTSSSSTAPAPLSIVVGDAVQIQNVQIADPSQAAQAPSFDGFYQVTSVGPGPNQFSYSQTGALLPDVATESAPETATGSVNYSQPVATVGLPLTDQGIGINPETQQAVLLDPTTGGLITFFSLLDQSVTTLSLKTPTPGTTAQEVGTVAAAYNPLTNTVVTVNPVTNTLSVIDPTTPRRLNNSSPYPTLPGPVAVAVDPGTNTAVVANQTDGSVSVLNLGPIQPFSITNTSPKTILTTSTLGSGPSPTSQTLTVTGTGFVCSNGTTSFIVRLDGVALATSCVGNGSRELTATVRADMLTSAHRYAVDVMDPSGAVTNAESLMVELGVDVTSCGPAPEPSGVAIDPVQNIAAVSLFGCNSLALIDMAPPNVGTGTSVQVGMNPIGVAVLPRLHIAVVANNGGTGTASIVDELQHSVTQTVSAGSGATGAAANEATGEVAIANSVANTVTIVNAVTGGTSSISTGQHPVAVGFNYVNHQVGVADFGSTLTQQLFGVSGGTSGSQSQTFAVSSPTSVVYDPAPTDCGSNNNGTTTNTTGCFIVASSGGNSVSIIDPVNSVQQTFRIGINPTAIAYNFRNSTLVSTNTASHTITVADLLGLKVRAALSLPPTLAVNSNLALSLTAQGTPQYAVDVHPFLNVAVIADTANGRVLFVPLPY